MTARLTDSPDTRSALEDVRPNFLVAFLLRQGWDTIARADDRSYVVLEAPMTKHVQVKVPLDRRYSDYAAALEIAVERTAEGLETSPLDVLVRLSQEQNDILLVTAHVETSHSLNAEYGLQLLNASWRTLAAGAWAEDAGSRKPLYSGPRSGRLSSFLGNIRLAHTRAGSFRFPFMSPIPEPEGEGDVLDLVVESFERRAIRKTIGAVAAAVDAAVELLDRGAFSFRERIPDGVSANLCRALASIPDEVPVTFEASWSPVVPEAARSISIEPGLVEAFDEAADRLGPEAATGRITVVGHVRLLHREHGEESGEIGVRSVLRDSPGVYRVDLDADAYAQAVEAHGADRTVLVEGEVDRYGTAGRRLIDATFRVLGIELPADIADLDSPF